MAFTPEPDIGGGSNFLILDAGPIDVPNVNIGDVSGGTTSPAAAQAADEIEEFAAEGGGRLPIVYGRHLIAGTLAVLKYTTGSPNVLIMVFVLGDGQGNGGGHGEWNQAVAVYYAGTAQSVSPNSTTNGYRFYKGFISTGIADANQPVDAFLSSGLAYSGTPYTILRLSGTDADAKRPDLVKGVYEGRLVNDYDATGRKSGYGYSVNPARVAADRILAYYERKYPNDLTLAARKLQEKVDWESWFTWRNNCEEEIVWDTGTGIIDIPRFEAHVVFTDDAILADALDRITAAAAAHWYDDGQKIGFLPPTDRAPVHHFDESNMIGSPKIRPRDLRQRANRYYCEFRDIDDTFHGKAAIEVRRDALIKQAGEIRSNRALPPMHQSQAERVTHFQASLETDNPNICALIGDATSIGVTPGDFVAVSHSAVRTNQGTISWTHQRCLVLTASLASAEDGADICTFTVQQIDGPLYSDFKHGQRQGALTP